MTQMSCTNQVEQCVPCGPFGAYAKTLLSKCGTTGIHGETLVCSECENKGVIKISYATQPREFGEDGYEIEDGYDI